MVAAVFNMNGRMRDPDAVTVLLVIANVSFNTFGTNVIAAQRSSLLQNMHSNPCLSFV